MSWKFMIGESFMIYGQDMELPVKLKVYMITVTTHILIYVLHNKQV